MDLKKLISYNVKTNSKEIGKNDVFIAIGKGHEYIEEALKNGASYVISEVSYKSLKVIKVNSTVEALGELAKLKRGLYKIPLIAVTGSCGKTTTKEFIYQLLDIKFNVLKSLKNYNNHIGLPSTLLKINSNHDIVVVELGMNHQNEISYLSKICQPNCSVITNIGTAHIGNLGSKENIFKAKLEILDGMSEGFLVVDLTDKYLKKIKNKKVEIIKNIFNISKIKYYKNYTAFTLEYNKIKYDVIFNIPGKHMLTDLILSMKVALLYGVKIEDILSKINHLKNNDGRFKIYEKDITLIDDSYNSSFEAVKESLSYLKKFKNKKIIILADMLELGDYSIYYHKKIEKYLKKIKNKDVYLYGELTKLINGKHFDLLDDLKKNLNINKGDVVFIKGSHSTNIALISDYLKESYNLE